MTVPGLVTFHIAIEVPDALRCHGIEARGDGVLLEVNRLCEAVTE